MNTHADDDGRDATGDFFDLSGRHHAISVDNVQPPGSVDRSATSPIGRRLLELVSAGTEAAGWLSRQPGRGHDTVSTFTLHFGEQRMAVFLTGAADVASVPAMAAVRDIIRSPTVVALVVDCAELDFIDCAGLEELLAWDKLARRHTTVLTFRRVPPSLQRLVELCDLQAVLAITDYLTESH